MNRTLLALCCTSLVACAVDPEDVDVTAAEQDLTGVVRYPVLSGTSPVTMSLGPWAGRVCVLTLVEGYLTTEAAGGTGSGQVAIVQNGSNWELRVSPSVPGKRLSAAAACFNTLTLSNEVFWTANQPPISLGNYFSNGRCFLTSLTTNRFGFAQGGFRTWTDNVEIQHNTSGVTMFGSQSGGVRAGARCVTVTSQLANTLFSAPALPGTQTVDVAVTPANTACGLTRVFGRFTGPLPNDPAQIQPGVRIVPIGNQYRATAKNQTGARALCVN